MRRTKTSERGDDLQPGWEQKTSRRKSAKRRAALSAALAAGALAVPLHQGSAACTTSGPPGSGCSDPIQEAISADQAAIQFINQAQQLDQEQGIRPDPIDRDLDHALQDNKQAIHFLSQAEEASIRGPSGLHTERVFLDQARDENNDAIAYLNDAQQEAAIRGPDGGFPQDVQNAINEDQAAIHFIDQAEGNT